VSNTQSNKPQAKLGACSTWFKYEKMKEMQMMKTSRRIIFVLGILVMGNFLATGGCIAESINLSERQTVYVPVYSHIYVMRGHTYDLGISLSIRNTDPAHPITIVSVSYNDSNGNLVRNYLESPIQLNHLASKDFFVSEMDKTGGFGASFVVKWKSAIKVNEPIIEGVMAGTKSGQGISFVSRGKAIEDDSKK
jgi:Protein of unknown function (DUF3124)